MDVVLAERVLYVIGLFVVLPVLVELVDLAGDVALFPHVEALVDLGEAALAEQHEEEVALVEHGVVVVAALVLVVYPLQLPVQQTCCRLYLIFNKIKTKKDSKSFSITEILHETNTTNLTFCIIIYNN